MQCGVKPMPYRSATWIRVEVALNLHSRSHFCSSPSHDGIGAALARAQGGILAVDVIFYNNNVRPDVRVRLVHYALH